MNTTNMSLHGNFDGDVSSMDGAIALPRRNGELVFDAPWQSRAFGMAVALSQAGHFTWDVFRANLARFIARNDQHGIDEYYLCWLDALETSMRPGNVFDEDVLRSREAEYRNHEREEIF